MVRSGRLGERWMAVEFTAAVAEKRHDGGSA
jgi:hypothetical protein